MVSASSSALAFWRRSCARPSWPSAPYQNSPSTSGTVTARGRGGAARGRSKVAYASRRLDSARRRSPATARARPSQERRDDVEVGLPAGLSSRPGDVVEGRGRSLREGLDLVRIGDIVPALSVAEAGVEARERQLHRAGGRKVACGEVRLELAEGDSSAVTERDCLLDLDRHDDVAVRDSPSVLDRHEPEVADQLAGTARLLGGRERRRAEREQVVPIVVVAAAVAAGVLSGRRRQGARRRDRAASRRALRAGL